MTTAPKPLARAVLPRHRAPALMRSPPEAAVNDDAVAATVRGMFGRDSIYLLLWVTQLGFAALFTPVSTRLLGPSRFGLVASSIAIMQVLVAIGSMSLQSAVQRRYASAGGERDARRLVTLAIAISLATFAVAEITGPAWSSALGLGPYPLVVRYAVGWASLTAISNAALGLMRSRDQLAPFATVSLMQSVVAEGLSLVFVLLVRRTAAEYVLGQLVAQAAAVAFALVVTRPLRLRGGDHEMARAALVFAVPLVPALVATFVLEASDRLVIQHFLGAASVARYAIAYNIGLVPMLALGALNTVWMPRVFALADTSARDSVLAQSRDALYALLVPAVAGLGIGAAVMLRIWAPPSYRPDSLSVIVAIVATTSFAVAGGMSHTRTMLAAGRTGPVALATGSAAAVNLGLNILLVPALGIAGSAGATFVSYVLLQALLAAGARTVVRLRRPRPALLLGMFAAAAIAFGATRLPLTPGFLALRVTLGAACLAVFVAMTLTLAGGRASALAERIATPFMSRLAPVVE
jgi:O-antigen/teichoic acid export membrane protein